MIWLAGSRPFRLGGVRHNGAMPSDSAPRLKPAGGTATDELTREQVLSAEPWLTIVWDDPVNLMSYVTHVFSSYFHYDHSVAERLMMQVHMEGRAVVSSGSREAMETDANAMHGFGLWATLDRAQ